MSMKTHKKPKYLTRARDCFPTSNSELAILEKRARQIAQIEIQKVQDKNVVSYIQFKLNKNENYGVTYDVTKEVIQNIPITIIPCALDFIAGVINRRGMLINVIDLKKFFGIEQQHKIVNHNIIVVKNKESQVGFLVDEIERSGTCSMDKLDPPIPSNNAIKPSYIIGLDQGQIAIINTETILMEIESLLVK
jgi:purine-binding chemotaxis protein CheW